MVLTNLRRDLLEEQHEALEFTKKLKRFIISFSTGLGKTYVALATYDQKCFIREGLRMVVICPKTAIVSWEDETKDYTEFSLQSFADSQYKPRLNSQKNIFLFTYTSGQKYEDVLKEIYDLGPVILILDELHTVKNPETQMAEFIRSLRDRSVYVYGLSATLIINHLEDLYGCVNMIFPGILGDKQTFLDTYCLYKDRSITNRKCYRPFPGYIRKDSVCPICKSPLSILKYCGLIKCTHCPHSWTSKWITIKEVCGHQNLDQLKKIMEQISITRYRKFNVEFIYKYAKLNYEEEQRYELAAKGIIHEVENTREFVGRLPDLQLCANNAIKLDGDFNQRFTELSSKEKLLIEEILSSSTPCIVYSFYCTSIRRLEGILKNIGRKVHVITGSTPGEIRKKIKSQFSNNDVLLATKAGSISLNLQASDRVIFYDTPWSLGDLIQAIGRICRIGTKHDLQKVTVITLEDTIDVYKTELIKAHSEKFKNIFGDNPNLDPNVKAMTLHAIKSMRSRLLWRFKSRHSAPEKVERVPEAFTASMLTSQEVFDTSSAEDFDLSSIEFGKE